MTASSLSKLIAQLQKISFPQKAREILEERGLACPSQSMLKKARDCKEGAKSEGEIIENLKRKLSMLQEIDGKLYMVYPKCYCHHLKNFEGKVPKNYCYCSEFWVKRLFEEALGREVEAEIEKSVQWGNEKCLIRIDMS